MKSAWTINEMHWMEVSIELFMLQIVVFVPFGGSMGRHIIMNSLGGTFVYCVDVRWNYVIVTTLV